MDYSDNNINNIKMASKKGGLARTCIASCFFIYTIFLLAAINLLPLDDHAYSLLYIINSIFSLYCVWKTQGKGMTIFFFYTIAYHLFIGGRFYAYFLNNDLDIFQSTFFYQYELNNTGKTDLFTWIIAFLNFSVLGHMCVHLKNKFVLRFIPKTKVKKENLSALLNKVYPLFVLLCLKKAVTGFLYVMRVGYGVSEILLDSEYSLSYIDKFTDMLLIIFTALTIAYCDIKLIKKFFGLYLLVSLISILGGSRGTFGAVVFLAIWTYSKFYKINFRKLVLYGSFGLGVMLFLFGLSSRGIADGISALGPLNAISLFLYTNGISMMVFDVSTQINNYPLLPYFQTLFTGANFIYSFFSGIHLNAQDISFQGFLCYNLNPDLFNSGLGLGWTANSDVFLFSNGNIFGYCILSFILGSLIAYIDRASQYSQFYIYFAASLAPGLFLMPRGSLAAFFPMIPYIYLFYLLLVKLSNKYKF